MEGIAFDTRAVPFLVFCYDCHMQQMEWGFRDLLMMTPEERAAQPPVEKSLDDLGVEDLPEALMKREVQEAIDGMLERHAGLEVKIVGDFQKAARGLIEVYGVKLAARLVQVPQDSILKAWRDGEAKPNQWQLRPLLHIWDITQIVAGKGGKKEAKRWVIEPNDYLGGYSPAACMSHDPSLVRMAALRYLMG